ncbi:aspartate-ammonia ligase [Lachnospiraceae bacterium XBB1006]|nr:aspartate-ammonia ligase [Lachnospiraceae bacterium XBB1006]
MSRMYIPDGYRPALNLKETQIAIKQIKDFFQQQLTAELNLHRVTAPLFVTPESGLNDNLNGVERPVCFGVREQGDKPVEVVHSLAKWKRMALGRYDFSVGEGLYTDMNAIRRDEDTDNIHSIYVDQWDWECIITKEARTEETLRKYVKSVYAALRVTEKYVANRYEYVHCILPEEITFITTQELENRWPHLEPTEREYEAAKAYGAIFLMKIGDVLASGKKHDGRAPDYDDWELNGDIIVYYPVNDISLELSSMGIRVDEDRLQIQLQKAGCPERAALPFQRAVLEGRLPYTIGGGIGQSRICMFFLRKCHIGEVQCSFWPEEDIAYAKEHGVIIL